MSETNPLLSRWAAGQATLSGWLFSPDLLIAEVMASCGFDEVVVDQQHGAIGPGDLVGIFAALAGRGATVVTRVPANDPASIGRSLDMGAQGIMVPMINTPGEAARAVAACRYAPRGVRSFGPIRARMTVGSSDPTELERTALILQVETAAGLEHVDEIVAIPGVDAIYVGPFDLGLSLGLTPNVERRPAAESQRLAGAIDAIREACARAGKVAGIFCSDGASAKRYLDQGFRMVTVATDLDLIALHGKRELAAARGLQG